MDADPASPDWFSRLVAPIQSPLVMHDTAFLTSWASSRYVTFE